MFQDIGKHIYDNHFIPRPPQPEDILFICSGQRFLFRESGGQMELPQFGDAVKMWSVDFDRLTYLFTIDDIAIFMLDQDADERSGYTYHGFMEIRGHQPGWLTFAAATASHLAHWYQFNRFCGKCGAEFEPSDIERALVCAKCGNTIYPSISPVVITAVTNGEKILLTQYNPEHSPYKNYALIAGFAEIGEALEDTVRREVMEEVGLSVTNIHYYKSQPWPYSFSLLSGFFADVKGGSEITLEEDELSKAVWFTRENIPQGPDGRSSLTWDMVEAFRNREFE
jgi:NTP pyrophosphohydrolases containing a Zn-finger, probably nucleic-acid-binding